MNTIMNKDVGTSGGGQLGLPRFSVKKLGDSDKTIVSREGDCPPKSCTVSPPSVSDPSMAILDTSSMNKGADTYHSSQLGPQRAPGQQCDSILEGPVDCTKKQAALKEHRRPNSSKVLLQHSGKHLKTCDSFSLAAADLSTKLLEHDRNAKNWTQPLIIPQDNDTTCDVGCALMGKQSKTPPNAVDQPKKYPRGTCIRLPTRFQGKDAFPDVKKMLENGGPPLTVRQVPSQSRSSAQRLFNWTLCCPGHLINAGKQTQFDEGKAAMSGIRG